MGGENLCCQSLPSMVLASTLDTEIENSELRFMYLGRKKIKPQNKTKQNTNQS